MKIKSLLLAGVAFVALNAFAANETFTAPDITVDNVEQLGQLINVPMTLTLEEGVTWKNIEIHVTLPTGFYPILDEYELCGDGGADIAKNKKGVPYVTFTDNFAIWTQDGDFVEYNEGKWPHYKVVGANMTGNPNPSGEVYVMNIAPREGEAIDGDFEITAYAKIILSDDSEVVIPEQGGAAGAPAKEGEDLIEAKLCGVSVSNISGPNPGTGVNDVNAAKTVTSVKYINAAGMVSDTAFDGINIVVTKYADGSQSTAKVVK